MLLFTLVISLWSFAGTPRRPVDPRQSPSYSPRATAPSCALPSGLRQLRGDRTVGSLVGPSDTQQPRQSGSTVGTLRARRDSPRAAHFHAPKKTATEVAAFLTAFRQNEAYLIFKLYHFFVFLSSLRENGAAAPSHRQRCCRRPLRSRCDPARSLHADCPFDGDADCSPS